MTRPIELLALLTLVGNRDRAALGTGPAELRQTCTPEEVGRRRSLWCPAYDRCLDVALRRRWRSWSCEDCSLFPHATPPGSASRSGPWA